MPKMKGRVLGKIRELVITQEQHTRLLEYTTGTGGRQDLCQRVYDSAKIKDGKLVAHVYGNDLERIGTLIERADSGGWQDLFREIVAANK